MTQEVHLLDLGRAVAASAGLLDLVSFTTTRLDSHTHTTPSTKRHACRETCYDPPQLAASVHSWLQYTLGGTTHHGVRNVK